MNITEICLRASTTLTFEVSTATPMVFMLRPRSGNAQWVRREGYEISPFVDVTEVTDGFGNLCQRLVAPAGDFCVRTEAEVLVSVDGLSDPENRSLKTQDIGFVAIPDVPDDALIYLLPSRYCESDRFSQMALEVVAGAALGYDQVAAITTWVRNNIRNVPLSSTYPVSAIEVNARQEGVCRDLAQIAIALCRALCIPARLVVGYLHALEPMDIHAWFEAYVGGRWWIFDAAVENQAEARIAIARGRDATDVAIYNQYGPMLLPTEMEVVVEKIPV